MKGLAKFGAALCPLCLIFAALVAGCGGGKAGEKDAAAEVPPPVQVENAGDPSHVTVDPPDQFPLATVGEYKSAAELTATGVVTPDISRTVPVISIASGRVVDIRTRRDDLFERGVAGQGGGDPDLYLGEVTRDQDVAGVGAASEDAVGDAAGEHAGLARAGAGQDADGLGLGLHRSPLVLVEVGFHRPSDRTERV